MKHATKKSTESLFNPTTSLKLSREVCVCGCKEKKTNSKNDYQIHNKVKMISLEQSIQLEILCQLVKGQYIINL